MKNLKKMYEELNMKIFSALHDEKGQTIIEYTLVIVLVSIVLIIALMSSGISNGISNAASKVGSKLSS